MMRSSNRSGRGTSRFLRTGRISLHARVRVHPALSLLLLSPLAGCGNGGPVEPPKVGSVRVTTATTGYGIPDGYTISVQVESSQEIGANDVATLENVPVGVYTVRLRGVAEHCTAAGGGQTVIEVLEDEEADVAFSVNCVASELLVRTNTTGPPARSTGWSIRLNESQSQSIAPNGEVAFGVAPRDHNVRLAGMPDNCATPGANPVIVIVPAMTSTGVTFQVECESGELTVTVSTDGDPDPATAYTVVARDQAESVDTDGSVVFSELPTGETEVRLDGVPDHCTVEGQNPRGVEVPGSTHFEVVCEAPAGRAVLRLPEWTGFFVHAGVAAHFEREDHFGVLSFQSASVRNSGSGSQWTAESAATGSYEVFTSGDELTGFANSGTGSARLQNSNAHGVLQAAGGGGSSVWFKVVDGNVVLRLTGTMQTNRSDGGSFEATLYRTEGVHVPVFSYKSDLQQPLFELDVSEVLEPGEYRVVISFGSGFICDGLCSIETNGNFSATVTFGDDG